MREKKDYFPFYKIKEMVPVVSQINLMHVTNILEISHRTLKTQCLLLVLPLTSRTF